MYLSIPLATDIPIQLRRTLPLSISCEETQLAIFDGREKPTPLAPLAVNIAALTPITSPARLNIGPPELPWLMAASVWIYCCSFKPILRDLAEIIPCDTLTPSPYGFPKVKTLSPIRALSALPNLICLKVSGWPFFDFPLIFKTAKSLGVSTPTILASYVLPLSVITVIFFALLITWAFVKICPSLRIKKPEPNASLPLNAGSSITLSISSLSLTVWRSVEMLTTEGINSSTKSAYESIANAGIVIKQNTAENNKRIRPNLYFKDLPKYLKNSPSGAITIDVSSSKELR